MDGRSWMTKVMGSANGILAQSAEMGSAADPVRHHVPGLPGDTYVGPTASSAAWPSPTRRSLPAASVAGRPPLWLVSEELTGVHYPLDVS